MSSIGSYKKTIIAQLTTIFNSHVNTLKNQLNINIKEWKVIGDKDNFTVLGMDEQGWIYFWKDAKWNIL